MTEYEEYDWAELPADALAAAKTLGYNENIWDTDKQVEADDCDWDELTSEQQAAAKVLGYSEKTWV